MAVGLMEIRVSLMHRIQVLVRVPLEIIVMLMSRILEILMDREVLVDRVISVHTRNIGVLMLTYFFLLCWDLGH